AGRAGDRLLGVLEVGELLPGEEDVLPAVVVGNIDLALLADQEHTAPFDLLALEEFLRIRWPHAAIVPGERQRRHVAAGRELVTDDFPARRVLRLVRITAERFDGSWIFQVERPERGVENVAGHVAQGAGAEIPPAAPGERVINTVVPLLLAPPLGLD